MKTVYLIDYDLSRNSGVIQKIKQQAYQIIIYIMAICFYIKVKDLETRIELLEHLKQNDVLAGFHYVPLHSAPAGLKFGRFNDNDELTTVESERLVRLPMYYGLRNSDIQIIIKAIQKFFKNQ